MLRPGVVHVAGHGTLVVPGKESRQHEADDSPVLRLARLRLKLACRRPTPRPRLGCCTRGEGG